MKERTIGKFQIGSHRAEIHTITHADICPNEVDGITLTLLADGRKVQRVRVWIEPEAVPVVLRQLFGQMSLTRAAKHPDVLKLAGLSVLLAEEIEAGKKGVLSEES